MITALILVVVLGAKLMWSALKCLAKILMPVAHLVLVLCLIFSPGKSENLPDIEPAELTVQTKLLNGRSAPRKTASIESRFDFGDTLQETGQWSKNHQWVEVVGGETGTVWVHISYVSERPHFSMTNEKHSRIKIRKWPVTGRVIGYVQKGQTVEIEQLVLGWGKVKNGWIDTGYLVERE